MADEKKLTPVEELKNCIKFNPHVKEVYLDKAGNWFLHKGRTIVATLTKAEALKLDDKASLVPKVSEEEEEVIDPKKDDKTGKKK